MRAMKSVLIVTRMGYIEGVFTSFRALANSRGGVYIHGSHLVREEDQPQLYSGSHHSTAVFVGRKIRLCAQLKICPRVWLVERQSRSSGMAGKDPGL